MSAPTAAIQNAFSKSARRGRELWRFCVQNPRVGFRHSPFNEFASQGAPGSWLGCQSRCPARPGPGQSHGTVLGRNRVRGKPAPLRLAVMGETSLRGAHRLGSRAGALQAAKRVVLLMTRPLLVPRRVVWRAFQNNAARGCGVQTRV